MGDSRRGTFAGLLRLNRVSQGGTGEIGYWVAPHSCGRGLLTEAVAAVIAWGFSTDGLACTESSGGQSWATSGRRASLA